MGNYTEIEQEFSQRVNPLINTYLLNNRTGKTDEMMANDIRNIQNVELAKMRFEKMLSLAKETGRNVICYFSTWVQGVSANPNPEFSINDNDINGLMNAVASLDKNEGLDLILHTPGGSTMATDSIVKYLRKIFNMDIRVIVPHLAMSAGTMICCSAKEVIMGKESSLGPVDPQYKGVPAQGVMKEFKRAITETCEDPNRSLIWKEIISQYRPTFICECEYVSKLSEELVESWLSTCMFKNAKNKSKIIQKIMEKLMVHDASKMHDRHYDFDECKTMGLKVKKLEDNQIIQDKVLSIYHTYLLSTYKDYSIIKFIENHNGQTFIIRGQR